MIRYCLKKEQTLWRKYSVNNVWLSITFKYFNIYWILTFSPSAEELETKVKSDANLERLQELQKNLVWPAITELDSKAFIPEVSYSFTRLSFQWICFLVKYVLLLDCQTFKQFFSDVTHLAISSISANFTSTITVTITNVSRFTTSPTYCALWLHRHCS